MSTSPDVSLHWLARPTIFVKGAIVRTGGVPRYLDIPHEYLGRTSVKAGHLHEVLPGSQCNDVGGPGPLQHG